MTRTSPRRGAALAVGLAGALALAGATNAVAEEEVPTLDLGVEVLLADQLDVLEGKRVGLITNPTGVNRELTHTMDLLLENEEEGDYELTALYAPEHGILGGAPAGANIESYEDPRTGLTVWSLYGATQRPTEEMLADVDVLVFDIQDIGARFYTYIWTMYYAMDAAAEFGKDFIVLDRPNPLGDRMDGPILDPSLSSFVGLREIPMQHGLTVGELAAYFNGEFLEEPVENFAVIEMDGYDPDDFTEGYGLEWVAPSPNIPTIETAWAYVGTGLVESLNASEGRGTTKPFLWIGHGDIDETEAYDLAEELNARGLAGVHFRPMFANPTTSKEAGRLSGGVEIHITDPAAYVPVRTGLHVVDALYHGFDEVDWREGTVYPDQSCDEESDICWIDRLSGDKSVRMQLEAGVDPDVIIAGWDDDLAAFAESAEPYRLYADEEPTEEPTTDQPTEEPTTDQPTEEPTTDQPTEEPTTDDGVGDGDDNGDDNGSGNGAGGGGVGAGGAGALPTTGAPLTDLGILAGLVGLAGAGALLLHRRSVLA